jgi:hypothetical protein
MQLLSLLKRRQEFLCLARIVTAARELINHAVLLCKMTLVHRVLDSMLVTYKRSRFSAAIFASADVCST